jgi:hypothetical protein
MKSTLLACALALSIVSLGAAQEPKPTSASVEVKTTESITPWCYP